MRLMTCSTCKHEKSHSAFSESPSYSSGRRKQCKACTAEHVRKIRNPAVMTGEKSCSQCHEIKDVSQFYKHSSGLDGRRAQCKTCRSVYNKSLSLREGYTRKPKIKSVARNRAETLARYGIDQAEYERRLFSQGGGCALCGRAPEGEHLCVDHCHSTGRVRGILCRRCNRALAVFGDNEGGLWKAFTYVATPIARIS